MNLSDIAALVANGRLTPVKAHDVAASLSLDGSQVEIPCEATGCTTVAPLGRMHAIVMHYATTGDSGLAPFACENLQHFGCTPEHAIAAAVHCLCSHLLPPMAEHIKQLDATGRNWRGR